ncbi:Uncharacterised protein r2_g1271 [Pycnogonum litorale]
MITKKLIPTFPNNQESLQRKEVDKRFHTKSSFDKRYRTRLLPDLHIGKRVWDRHTDSTATVTSPAGTPRSYNLQSDDTQRNIRRNRSTLVTIPEQPSTLEESSTPLTTRCGKVIIPPDVLNL